MGVSKKRWTEDEERALREGVEKHGTGRWKHIKTDNDFSEILSLRSNVDLKDKWRNILVARGEREKPSAVRKERKRRQQEQQEQQRQREGGSPNSGGGAEAPDTPPQLGGAHEAKGARYADGAMATSSAWPAEEAAGAANTKDGDRSVAAGLHRPTQTEASAARREGQAHEAGTAMAPSSGSPNGPTPARPLSAEEMVIAAIIALKDDRLATCRAIHSWMAERYRGSLNQVESVGSFQDVERKVAQMCQEKKLLLREEGYYDIAPWNTCRGNDSRLQEEWAWRIQQSSRVFSSADDAAEVAARAVAEALQAAETAENAMAEAVALERQATAMKKQEAAATRPIKKR
mmetsp:Transcript_9988/g.34472  ORF Transcript_9988/g.34472 Transcript_9988/m.34472 type:complete len:346 (-) Transcript_9988:1956-2993(-)